MYSTRVCQGFTKELVGFQTITAIGPYNHAQFVIIQHEEFVKSRSIRRAYGPLLTTVPSLDRGKKMRCTVHKRYDERANRTRVQRVRPIVYECPFVDFIQLFPLFRRLEGNKIQRRSFSTTAITSFIGKVAAVRTAYK